ncbi:MAG: hypothetical protein ACXWWC_12895 [Chitinophagaceae bacterium]
MSKFVTSFFLFINIYFVSCTNNETINKKSLNPGSIYFDYQVWGDEGSKEVTIKLQYRYRNAEGITILPEHTGKVEFDGQVLEADTSKMNGFYYEALLPLENFGGEHSIVFTDLGNKQYREEFNFPIIYLKKEIASIISRKNLVLELAGLDSNEIVRVLLTDTSFYSRDIDKTDTVRNEKITITEMDLANLKNGPVHIEIFKEEERPLKETTKAGGWLSLSYSIKRVFELKDEAPIP